MMKRCFDIFFAFLLLLTLAPLMGFIAIMIFLFIGKPVLFIQARPGFKGKIFRLVKFRTMKNVFDSLGRPLPDEQRMTKFGRFLRKSSLDELPELWNVLKGEMSLVGPRPLLVEYLPLYTPEQARRHDVRPGITGLAQISGRNNLEWDRRFELDIYYVDHQSFWLDLKILAKTALKVLGAQDIEEKGQATMSRFKGSKK